MPRWPNNASGNETAELSDIPPMPASLQAKPETCTQRRSPLPKANAPRWTMVFTTRRWNEKANLAEYR